MISLAQALKAKLQSLAAVSAVIGDKVYPDFMPQRVARPGATYSHAGIDRLPHLNGTQSKVKIDTFRIEVASTRTYDVDAVRSAIDRELSGTKAEGRWNDGAAQGPIVTFCTLDDAATQVDRDRQADEHTRAAVCLLTITWIDEDQT